MPLGLSDQGRGVRTVRGRPADG